MTNIKRGGKLKIERKTPQYKKVTKQDLRLARHIGKMRKRANLTQEELASVSVFPILNCFIKLLGR